MEPEFKKWLKDGQTPRDFYELAGCRRLEARREILLDAISLANEFYFKCQGYGSPEVRKRAKTYQKQLAQARQMVDNPERWKQYNRDVIKRILDEFQQFAKEHSSPSDEEVKTWLEEDQIVAPSRVDQVFEEIHRRFPREVALLEIEESKAEAREEPDDLDDGPIVFEGIEDDGSGEIPFLLESLEKPNEGSQGKTIPKISSTQPQTAPPRPLSLEQQEPPAKRKFHIVGIDLGTTFSAIAYVDHNGKAHVVSNPEDQQRPILPSVVLFEDGEALIGQTALDNAYLDPDNVVQFAKRSLGERKEFEVDGQALTPEAISALILKKLVQYATGAIGEINRVVITVPAFFNEKRRAATVQCGEIANLKVEATLNEPSAALIAYDLHNDPELDKTDPQGQPLVKNYVVYDLGGGTFDVTVMAVSQNRVKELATGGNRELGGLDWDQALVDHVASEFEAAHGCSPKESSESLQGLMAECNKAKIQLSNRKRTVVVCTHAGKAQRVEITRETFEELTAAMLAMTELTVETCLRDAGLEWEDVTNVLMVGGSTLMPMVKLMLERISGKIPRSDIDPSTVVALGAAIYAGVLETRGAIQGASGSQQSEKDQPKEEPPSAPEPELPPRMLPGPRSQGFTRGASGSAPSPKPASEFVVEPLSPPSEDPSDDLELEVDLQLVNSHGVGVYATKRGQKVNVVMIPRNSELPTVQKQLFRTTRTNLRELRVRVSEGDSEERESCDMLGTCVLGPLPANLPKGTPVELHIGFRKDGRIQVSADCRGQRIGAEIEAKALLTEMQVHEERRKVNRLTSGV